jgi:hypothetical protein
MLGHDNGSINRLKSLINKGKYISSYLEEFPGIRAAHIAKVRVDGSNPFARSRFRRKINKLRTIQSSDLKVALPV